MDTISGFIQRSDNTDVDSKQTQIYRETYQSKWSTLNYELDYLR